MKVVLSEIEPEARMRDYQDPIFWLKDAHIVNVAYNATEPNVGLKMLLDNSSVKCYFLDTGLLISHSFDESEVVSDEPLGGWRVIGRGKSDRTFQRS